MHIVLVSDAWKPQVNGVVRNYECLIKVLEKRGHTVRVISPLEFKTIPCPTYPEISLSLFPKARLKQLLEAERPDAIHIATEGPLGWAARSICLERKWPFTTCYHSKFPEYIHERCGLPVGISYKVLRKFHGAAEKTIVTNKELGEELTGWGFENLALRRMGVDKDIFKPMKNFDKNFLDHTLKLPRPIFVCHGRLAPEKNLKQFIEMDLPGSKIVIGPGPLLEKFRKKYPKEKFNTLFTGFLPDEEMVKYIASADALGCPSVTETFGFVQLEALACGVPVAALPVTGPTAVLGDSKAGVMSNDLQQAALDVLKIKPEVCLERANKFSWEDGADDFLKCLKPFSQSAKSA